MILPALPPPPKRIEAVEAAESYKQHAPKELVADTEPQKITRTEFQFRRTILPIEGGRLLLRLTEYPRVAVDPNSMEFEVLGWGIKMPCSSVEELPNTMARRFLDLFSKADSGNLNSAETHFWAQILDQIDFQMFCIDRAAPHYVEGTLVRLDPVCLIDWHDGERTKVDSNVARSLACLRPGDHFGAYVKFGLENTIRSIERISLFADCLAPSDA